MNGNYFEGAGTVSVQWGSQTLSCSSLSMTSCTVTSPAGTACSSAPVSLTTSYGGTSNSQSFYYIPQPTLTSISPNGGPKAGGNSVQINGSSLWCSGQPTPVVNFIISCGASSHTLPATVLSYTSSQIALTVPASPCSGLASVVESFGSYTSNSLSYWYIHLGPPVVLSLTGILPNGSQASWDGVAGNQVIVQGDNFAVLTGDKHLVPASGLQVLFCTSPGNCVTIPYPSPGFTLNSPTQLTLNIPTGTGFSSGDVVAVVVQAANGSSQTGPPYGWQ
ncbi:MAG: hypothetical protein M1483_00550 [Actinobacteria bacterium]|nr:hypothetical protein [Actinomycetota bacterium]